MRCRGGRHTVLGGHLPHPQTSLSFRSGGALPMAGVARRSPEAAGAVRTERQAAGGQQALEEADWLRVG